ncbi:hypothetical protein [Nocardia transvalensis]|uniref:TPR repeat region-containing protein n=1 Tax=Nocardia transvalensis TaxID=37333 RepID=UPI00189337DF|nr:hypothetical protein [Nocardia transvalensis]MBF6331850.1 hypothetical protein [Nocardia transvalensis]
MTARTPLEWLRTCNPRILNRYADSWEEIGAGLEEIFQKYVDAVTKVDGNYWEGKAAVAAHDRATGDLRTIQTLADKLTALATQARQGHDAINEPLRRARGLLAECAQNGWSVTPLLSVIGSGEAQKLADMNRDLGDAARAAMAADGAVRDGLNRARSDLALAFASAAALGADQGKADGKHLVTDPEHMTDAEIQRLIDAGKLTPEQTAALQRGDTVTIPASHMEYLNQISRSLDGKSPQEIQQIMSKLPPDAQKGLANSLQFISTSTVTAGITGDPAIPAHGDANLLPKQIQESLTRKDLAVIEPNLSGVGAPAKYYLNGVADNQAIAKIVAAGDPQYKAGSALDRQLLDVGRQYLGAQTSYEQQRDKDLMSFNVDGKGTSDRALTEGIFSAVGSDKVAVEAVATDKAHGQRFITDVLQHDWTDDGKAASTLFQFGDQDASVKDPADRNDVVTAERTGRIMAAVGEAASSDDAWKKLSNIPGADGKSVGQLNPDLLRTVSHSMAPYVGDLAGVDQPNKPGFDVAHDGKSWINPKAPEVINYSGAANIFALMNTDTESGKFFNAAAMNQILAAESDYAVDPTGPNSSSWLSTAGTLHGLVDKGMLLETADEYKDQDDAAKAAYMRKSWAYELLKTSTGTGYGFGDDIGKFGSWAMGSGGDPMKQALIGPPPQPHAPPTLHGVNFDRDYNAILTFRQQFHGLPPDFQQDYPWAFSPEGKLLDYDTVWPKMANDEQKLKAFQQMVSQIGGDSNMMQNSYTAVVRKDG